MTGRGVLDVGCALGGAVKSLWSRGMPASGMDISATAASIATRVHLNGTANGPNCVGGVTGPRCFKSGSATRLPYSRGFVDAILSSYVLEHLKPSDVPFMMSEFRRVAQRALFLRIFTHEEIAKIPSGLLKTYNLTALHTTVWGEKEWLAAFHKYGFNLLECRPDFGYSFSAVFGVRGWAPPGWRAKARISCGGIFESSLNWLKDHLG